MEDFKFYETVSTVFIYQIKKKKGINMTATTLQCKPQRNWKVSHQAMKIKKVQYRLLYLGLCYLVICILNVKFACFKFLAEAKLIL